MTVPIPALDKRGFQVNRPVRYTIHMRADTTVDAQSIWCARNVTRKIYAFGTTFLSKAHYSAFNVSMYVKSESP